MNFEPRPSLPKGGGLPRVPRADPRARLPHEIAFLRNFDVAEAQLRAAVDRAAQLGVAVERPLIADETVGEDTYYRNLARHLDVPFVKHWPRLAAPLDLKSAIARGSAKLHASERPRLLVAPTGEALAVLLKAQARKLPLGALAITTPSHFAEILLRREADAVARAAAHDLPDATPGLSARGAFDRKAGILAGAAILTCLVGGIADSRIVTDVLGLVFLSSMMLRLIVCAAGLVPSSGPPPLVADREAPAYTVLVALYDEPGVAPALVAALKRLDYPRAKLEILLLLEADDEVTKRALYAQGLPPQMRIIVVPDGKPRTKPRALNVGLMLAKGDIVTVYDAEDRPDPLQLRKAAAMFAAMPPEVACLQARLAISNGARGLLAKFFAIEYAGLFDLFNIGIARLGLPMALGGTSNHFRTAVLRRLRGWDAWNVTEDADLGFRLARFGYATQSLDSATMEDAPLALGVWFKQRRRWMKGWMQTLVVLARDPRTLRDLGVWRYGLVALLLTNLVTGPLALPVFQALLILRFFIWGTPQPDDIPGYIEMGLAVSVAVLGMFSTIWCGYQGLRARRLRAFGPAVPLLFAYQAVISAATWMGLWDLIRRPYHWHKTQHDLAPSAVVAPPLATGFVTAFRGA